jgi:hypothetical protein
VHDEELLRALVGVSERLLLAAHQRAGEGFGTKPDDARWPYPFPLRSDLQVKHLFVQMEDAFAVAWTNLAVRTSPTAIGAIRFLAEGYVLIRWLTEPTDEMERRKRAYRFVLREIGETLRVLKHADDAEPATIRSLKESTGLLRDIAKQDGILHIGESPRTAHLFDTYLEPGYVIFSTTSEIGSHPGLLQMMLFHQDRGSKQINVDLTGAVGERAAWVSIAFDIFGRTCDEMGKALEWNDWLAETVLPIVQDAVPLLREAKSRWLTKWGFEPRDD